MISLVSPEYDFELFCHQMHGKDPVEVMDAAGTEIGYARRIHRQTTNDSDFRKGSRGRAYCDNLQRLIVLLLNGELPSDSTAEFVVAVKPLVQHLLKRWDIGKLRETFANLQPQGMNLPENLDPFIIVVSRSEVEAMNTSATLGALKRLTESPATTRQFVERVDIAFHGYDHTHEELFEIPEVRSFVHQLDEQFPFWLYFMSKQHLGLQCLLLCFLPPFLTEEARSKIFPERIDQLLTNRWFPAMNHICSFVGFSEDRIERLTERAVAYITTGRFPHDAKPFA
jgi:hypothetical protein